jgi:environmental stress-induced protein Ves
LKIVRASDCRSTRWKNGGGSTTQIAVEPAGASFDAFDWRISMATVATDGPFSAFAEIDRSLALVSGNGMALTIGSDAPVTLRRGSDPVSFAGDVATSARLIAGEITDLNVMTRRLRFSHRLRRIHEPVSCEFGADVGVVLSFNDSTTLASEHGVATLDHGDAAIIASARDGRFRIVPIGASDCYLVLLHEHQTD